MRGQHFNNFILNSRLLCAHSITFGFKWKKLEARPVLYQSLLIYPCFHILLYLAWAVPLEIICLPPYYELLYYNFASRDAGETMHLSLLKSCVMSKYDNSVCRFAPLYIRTPHSGQQRACHQPRPRYRGLQTCRGREYLWPPMFPSFWSGNYHFLTVTAIIMNHKNCKNRIMITFPEAQELSMWRH